MFKYIEKSIEHIKCVKLLRENIYTPMSFACDEA